ncbi:MAG: hypothetical protein CM15mP45_04620 [Deltaproteobacteria bacterium]|nr:MAG: hypothetical protein CM15mP45_04620 [Deltaproteobacteria bacterium]
MFHQRLLKSLRPLFGKKGQKPNSILQLGIVLEQIKASAVGSRVKKFSRGGFWNPLGLYYSIHHGKAGSLDLIRSVASNWVIYHVGRKHHPRERSVLGGVSSVSGFSDNVTSLFKNCIFATSALGQIQMSGYDSNFLEKMIENISSPRHLRIFADIHGGTRFPNGTRLGKHPSKAQLPALDEIQGDS